jgi:hypothetical protein
MADGYTVVQVSRKFGLMTMHSPAEPGTDVDAFDGVFDTFGEAEDFARSNVAGSIDGVMAVYAGRYPARETVEDGRPVIAFDAPDEQQRVVTIFYAGDDEVGPAGHADGGRVVPA